MSSIILRCSLGDVEISTLILRSPDRGNWVAHCGIGLGSKPAEGEAVSIRFAREDGSEDVFVGTVRRSRIVVDAENVSVTVVGGAGLLLAELSPRHHTAGTATVPAGVVAAGIVQATGATVRERLAAGVETALDAFQLQRWSRLGGTAKGALDILADALGIGWRVLADGTVWLGTETWPAVDGSRFRSSGDPMDGMVLYEATDGAPFVGGTAIDGVRAAEVCYHVAPGVHRVEVRPRMPGDPARTAPLDLYRASYAAKVVSQDAATGTLQLVADDARIGSDLRDIPFRLSIPGAKVTIPAGSRVRVRFEGSDPRGCYACDVDQDPAASKRVARVDDTVDAGSFTFVPGPPASLVYFPPGSIPPGTTPITGKITSGHPRFFLTNEGQS